MRCPKWLMGGLPDGVHDAVRRICIPLMRSEPWFPWSHYLPTYCSAKYFSILHEMRNNWTLWQHSTWFGKLRSHSPCYTFPHEIKHGLKGVFLALRCAIFRGRMMWLKWNWSYPLQCIYFWIFALVVCWNFSNQLLDSHRHSYPWDVVKSNVLLGNDDGRKLFCHLADATWIYTSSFNCNIAKVCDMQGWFYENWDLKIFWNLNMHFRHMWFLFLI